MFDELAMAGEPAVRVETGATRAAITALSWDTEGTSCEQNNLLRPGTAAGLRFRVGGAPARGEVFYRPLIGEREAKRGNC